MEMIIYLFLNRKTSYEQVINTISPQTTQPSYHRDTCFDAHLFRRLLCLYHVMRTLR